MTRAAAILAHLAEHGPANARAIASALGVTPAKIRDSVYHLCADGRADAIARDPSSGAVIYEITAEGRAEHENPVKPWPRIKAVLDKAGAKGAVVRDIATATGLESPVVTAVLKRQLEAGHVVVAGHVDIGRGSMRKAYRLAPRTQGLRRYDYSPEVGVVPIDKVPLELQVHADALRRRGFPVVPRVGGSWDVGWLSLSTADMIELAKGEISVSEILGVGR